MTSPATLGPRHAAAERYRSAVSDISQVLELTAEACQAPMAALKLLGGASAHFAATLGLSQPVEVPKSVSLCDLVSSADHALVVTDAARDPRLAGHPLVAGATHVRFVGAAPLHHGGHIVGALCVFDNARRRMSAVATRRLLERIASRVDAETGLRHRLAGQPFPAAAGHDDVVSTISHEIRTPLTAIRGNLELLADTPGAIAPEHQSRAEAVMRNADRLCRTVDNLLRAAGQQFRQPTGRPELVDLSQAVAAAVTALGERAAAVRAQFPATPVWVLADRRLLQLAIGHLLDNAVRFGADRPVIVTLTGTPQPALEIVDHGPGLTPAELDRLGEPFFRGHEARQREAPGLGLGVTISRGIVEAQGGVLRWANVPGAGVAARAVFPAAVSVLPASN